MQNCPVHHKLMVVKKKNIYGTVYECPVNGCTKTHQDYNYKKTEQKRCKVHGLVLDTDSKCIDCMHESSWC